MSLVITANPHPAQLYLVRLGETLEWQKQPLHIALAYLPDKEIFTPESLKPFLQLHQANANSLEQLAGTCLQDFFNHLLPVWVQFYFSIILENRFHQVCLEENQPGWKMDDAIRRIISTSEQQNGALL